MAAAFIIDASFFVFIIFIICFGSQRVMTLSEDIDFALTQSKLTSFEFDKSNAKKLKILGFMLMRVQTPLKIAIGSFGEINLRFFSRSINSIYSFIMLLKLVYND